MIEVTSTEIGQLSDGDLRFLVGRLCEAELELQGLSTKGVSCGGHQDAKDGGCDVRLNEPRFSTSSGEFLPRCDTVFQVKKPTLIPSKIRGEMTGHDDRLHPFFAKLAEKNGAYIIASGEGSTESAIKNRRQAMTDALRGHRIEGKIFVDYYDNDTLARWARKFPSVCLWVWEILGTKFIGWQTYGPWSKPSSGSVQDYIVDDEVRLQLPSGYQEKGVSALVGIRRLRETLQKPRSCARLVGLSGVGKTRLLEALFETNLGEDPLPKSLAHYCDAGDSPSPNPVHFASRLSVTGKAAILLVDNCSRQLHDTLAKTCQASTQLRLITVEYDVQDEIAEGTEVFRLEASSEDLIDKLVRLHYPQTSRINAGIIAKFSGGNSRVALSLASTLSASESLSGLQDEELFRRLFEQRKGPESSLLKTAQVCSLVYSFNANPSSKPSEIKVLAQLVSQNEREFLSNLAELKRRDLLQARGDMRSVLPHAVSNRLAERGLHELSYFVEDAFLPHERLRRSFCRRLGYLSQSSWVQGLASKWLSEGGILGRFESLSGEEWVLVELIAPTAPAAVIEGFKRVKKTENAKKFFSVTNRGYIHLDLLLLSLAYEPELFEDSIHLLSVFALSRWDGEQGNNFTEKIGHLFRLYLSGTKASKEMRVQVIKGFVESECLKQRKLGYLWLSESLRCRHFMGRSNHEFGGQPRDYGFWPRSSAALSEWYIYSLNFLDEHWKQFPDRTEQVRRVVVSHFRDLWGKSGINEKLDELARDLGKYSVWENGWRAAVETYYYDSKKLPSESNQRLLSLIEYLRPKHLIDEARAFAFSKGIQVYDVKESFGKIPLREAIKKSDEKTIKLGKAVAKNDEVLEELLPELIFDDRGFRVGHFGGGLALGAKNPLEMWNHFREVASCDSDKIPSFTVAGGFLGELNKSAPEMVDRILEEAVEDEVFGPSFPFLQMRIGWNDRGVERVLRSLESGLAEISRYSSLRLEGLSCTRMVEVLERLCDFEGGREIAIDILSLRFHGAKEESYSPALKSFARSLLLDGNFGKEVGGRERDLHYDAARIVEVCFKGVEAKNDARVLCKTLREQAETFDLSHHESGEILDAIASTQLVPLLEDYLCIGQERDSKHLYFHEWFLAESTLAENGWLAALKWCHDDPEIRFPGLAKSFDPFKRKGADDVAGWTDFGLELVKQAPTPAAVLNQFKHHLYPSGWTGSYGLTLKGMLPLVDQLRELGIRVVNQWVEECRVDMQQRIEIELARDAENNRRESERFE